MARALLPLDPEVVESGGLAAVPAIAQIHDGRTGSRA
jgi:hypothetical protein